MASVAQRDGELAASAKVTTYSEWRSRVSNADMNILCVKQTSIQSYHALLFNLYGKKKKEKQKASPLRKSNSKRHSMRSMDAEELKRKSGAKGPSPLSMWIPDEGKAKEEQDVKNSNAPNAEMRYTKCQRCAYVLFEPKIKVSFVAARDDDDTVPTVNRISSNDSTDSDTEKTYVKLMTPYVMREGLAAKRKFYRTRLRKTYRECLTRGQVMYRGLFGRGRDESGSQDEGKSEARATGAFSLKDLSVLQWARCEKLLFWNLMWYFSSQVVADSVYHIVRTHG